jgi:hypothetical protein
MDETRLRSCFGAGGVRVAAADGRRSGSGMRTPFTRPPRNRSWRPSSHRVSCRKSSPRSRARRRRQERQRRTVLGTRGGRKRRPVNCWSGRRSEKRAVKRASPQSRLHRAAPSLPVPVSRVFGRARQYAKKTFVWMGTEPQGSGTRARLGRAPKGLARANNSLRWEATRARVLEWKRFRSAEVDRTHRRSRRPRSATKRTTETRGLARRSHCKAHDARGGDENERRRCASFRSAF